jgi:4a-hydroxytetrahydrobiopterin dehydratase
LDFLQQFDFQAFNPITHYPNNAITHPTMWTEKNKALEATFQFKDFSQAFAFMTEVAIAAEKIDHHPDWTNVWNKVSFRLNTHSAGGKVTERDWKLAKAIDAIAERYRAAS